MERYINQLVAIDTILKNPPDAHYPSWYAAQIADLPAANVVEVVHGKWEYDHWCEFKCSICDHQSQSEPRGKEKFCPNCGAKMDGGK